MEDNRKSDIENTEKLPVIDPDDFPEENDPSGTLLRIFMKIGLFLAIVIVVTLVSRFIYIKVNGENLSLIDDTKLTFTGHNGNGYADVMFHPENTTLNRLNTKRDRMERYHQNTDNMNELIDSISCRLDYKDHLSNGMNVTYTCDYDKKAAKKAGYHIIDDVRTYTVMGLSDYTYIDPYKDLETSWNTESDTPVLEVTPSPQNKDLFTYSSTYDGNGHAVIHARPDEKALHQKGYEVKKSQRTKKVPVSSPPQKITDFHTLSINETDNLKQQAVQSYQEDRNNCDSHSDDQLSLISSDVQIVSWSQDPEGICHAILHVSNTYTNHVTYSFNITCAGTVWRNEDGTLSFSSDHEKTCSFLRQGRQSVADK